MSYVITLIAPQQDENLYKSVFAFLNINNFTPQICGAYEAIIPTPLSHQTLSDIRQKFTLDIIQQPTNTRTKRLFFADMDATIVEQETLDELAAFAGLKTKVAAITTRAMQGELDFHQALIQRVSLLKNLPESALAQTAAATTFTQGAPALLSALKSADIHTVLVSGGFTYFTAHTAHALGFDAHYGNILEIENNVLTGNVIPPILDKDFKKSCLINTAQQLGIPLSQTIAIGDGANDLPMLQTAGLGIGYRPKPLLQKALDNHLFFTGLNSLIPVLGLNAP